jgi:hypothetical protein
MALPHVRQVPLVIGNTGNGAQCACDPRQSAAQAHHRAAPFSPGREIVRSKSA